LPSLKRPENAPRIELPPRRAIVACDTDVLVVGGGPAGLGAAIGAAQAGARVVLAERYGFLGGNATAALVMPLMSFHTSQPTKEKKGATTLLPTDHGPGEAIIAGALKTLLERLVRAGGAIEPSLATGYVVPFDPEWFKLIALELLDEAGVQFLFHSFASGVLGSGCVEGAVMETKSGPLALRARVTIDCTGDGDLAVLAGAPAEIGRADGLVQPMTLMFRIVEFYRAGFEAYVEQHPKQWRGVHGLWDLVREASEAGELRLPREDILFFATPHEEEVSVNSTRVTRVLGTDVWDLAFAEWASRRQMRQIAEFLRRYVPGFEKSYVAQSGVQVGVRETRRGPRRLSAHRRRRAGGAQVRRCDRARRLSDRHPQSHRHGHGAEAPAARRIVRHPDALPPAAQHRRPDRRRALHLGHARSAFVVSRHADRHGDRPGGRRMRGARGAARRAAASGRRRRSAARARAPGRKPALRSRARATSGIDPTRNCL